MKRVLLILFLLVFLVAGVAAWIILGSATGIDTSSRYLYIRSNAATRQAVLDSIRKNDLLSHMRAFDWLAARMKYWDNIRPGRYEIKSGASLLDIIRMLRNGSQAPLNLVITKIRTRQDLARMVGRKFEADSSDMMAWLMRADSLALYNAEPETALWNVLPDTYTYYWTADPDEIYRKFYQASRDFWNDERRQKADSIGLTPLQIYIMASIIEEETTNHDEKPLMASVYLNRLRKGEPLGADPTVKFALQDFSITRVTGEHTSVVSPYNTYKNRGLPPGPICTPSRKTLDAVLNPAQTNYMFFVAHPNMRQEHIFSETYEEHKKRARQYHRALDSLKKARETR